MLRYSLRALLDMRDVNRVLPALHESSAMHNRNSRKRVFAEMNTKLRLLTTAPTTGECVNMYA
jgi:hypothetical protein